jgi:hypothetical protein
MLSVNILAIKSTHTIYFVDTIFHKRFKDCFGINISGCKDITVENGMSSTLEQVLEEIQSCCESIVNTPLGIVIKLKKELFSPDWPGFSIKKFEWVFNKLNLFGWGWFVASGSIIIPQAQIIYSYNEKKLESEGISSPPQKEDSRIETIQSVNENLQNLENIKEHLHKLKTAFSPRMSENEIQESLSFLFKKGLTSKEISFRTGASLATIYRYIPKEMKRPYEKKKDNN